MFHKLKNPSASVGKNQYFKTMEFSISFTHVYREGEKILLFLLIYIYSELVLYLLGNLFKNSTKSFLPWSSIGSTEVTVLLYQRIHCVYKLKPQEQKIRIFSQGCKE